MGSQEPYVMKLTEDQMAQLLSAFWVQANLPDNLPSNIEAIAHSFILTLIVLRIKVEFYMYFITLSLSFFVSQYMLNFCFWIDHAW